MKFPNNAIAINTTANMIAPESTLLVKNNKTKKITA